MGGIVCFPEVWIHPADIPMIARNGEGYQGDTLRQQLATPIAGEFTIRE